MMLWQASVSKEKCSSGPHDDSPEDTSRVRTGFVAHWRRKHDGRGGLLEMQRVSNEPSTHRRLSSLT